MKCQRSELTSILFVTFSNFLQQSTEGNDEHNDKNEHYYQFKFHSGKQKAFTYYMLKAVEQLIGTLQSSKVDSHNENFQIQ